MHPGSFMFYILTLLNEDETYQATMCPAVTGKFIIIVVDSILCFLCS